MSTVTFSNIGVIKSLEFDLPDDRGGVLVLKGANKKGKSTAIRALRGLLAGKGKLDPRDGAVRGSAEAFGKRASVSTQTRYTGDSTAESLEGKFDFSDLVHPEAKEAETRDRIRIKALLSLVGVEADPSLFYDLCGGQAQFEQLVPEEAIKKKDLVELAGIVHRALHAAAKEKESEASYAAGHAKACREAVGEGVDEVNGETELKPLHNEASLLSATVRVLQERASAAARMRTDVEESKKSLERVKSCYDGPTVAKATEQTIRAADLVDRARDELIKAQNTLRRAEATVKEAESVSRESQERLRTAEQHVAAVDAIQRAICEAQAVLKEAPTEEQITAASKAATEAQEKLEQGIRLRDAQQKLIEAKGHETAAEKANREAEKLRNAARSVDHVLSQKLPTGPLRAEGGRLVLDTERGESAPYDDCSDGEKWMYALPYGIGAVGEQGVLAVAQDAWQDCDADARAAIAAQCQEAKVWIITGEVADGELRAEVFEPEAVEA